jgi:site-specific DNA recombinase
VDKSYVSRVVNLAFLAPDIIESIISGHQPADLNVEKLMKRTDLPLDWVQQRQLLTR